MKHTVFILLLSNLLFANYAYQEKNAGKIDMHGGKKQKLIDKPSNLSGKPFMLGNIGLQGSLKKDNKENNTTSKDTK